MQSSSCEKCALWGQRSRKAAPLHLLGSRSGCQQVCLSTAAEGGLLAAGRGRLDRRLEQVSALIPAAACTVLSHVTALCCAVPLAA